MKDLKQIQEFFSKPLEEGKQLDIVDFAKIVQAVQQTGHPATVLYIHKFNEIEILTGMNAPDDMLRDLSNAVDSLGYGRDNIIIAADSSNLSRREYNDIRRVNGGHKDYFEEATKEEENEFHTKLDKLVHKTFGHSSDEKEEMDENIAIQMAIAKAIADRKNKDKKKVKEYNTGIYYDPAKERNAPKAKEASKSGIEKVKDMLKKIMKEGDITIDDKTEFKLQLKHLLDKHVIQKEDLADYEEKDADYDKLYSDYLYKMVKEVATEKGYSKFLVSKDNPKGETRGLDTKTMNKILMNVIKDLDELKQLGEGVIEEELCPKGKAYIKKRQAAGEKSSAYLSGRAVKVCKGQMKG
jgi:hypothetical protein